MRRQNAPVSYLPVTLASLGEGNDCDVSHFFSRRCGQGSEDVRLSCLFRSCFLSSGRCISPVPSLFAFSSSHLSFRVPRSHYAPGSRQSTCRRHGQTRRDHHGRLTLGHLTTRAPRPHHPLRLSPRPADRHPRATAQRLAARRQTVSFVQVGQKSGETQAQPHSLPTDVQTTLHRNLRRMPCEHQIPLQALARRTLAFREISAGTACEEKPAACRIQRRPYRAG